MPSGFMNMYECVAGEFVTYFVVFSNTVTITRITSLRYILHGVRDVSSRPQSETPTMSGLKPPAQLSLEGNLQANYRNWIRSFEVYSIASGVADKAEVVQCNVFLHVAGPEAQKVHATMEFAEADVDQIAPLKAKFAAFCEGKRNITVIRYQFNSRTQKDGESFDSFLTELKQLIKDCEFGDALRDSLLRDRVVCGIRDETTREKLLQTEDLTLEKCVNTCRISESSANQLKTLTDTKEKDVDAVGRSFQNSTAYGRGSHDRSRNKHRGTFDKRSQSEKCGNCDGQAHADYTQCPAYGKECGYCRRMNHFKASCRTLARSEKQRVRPQAPSSSSIHDVTLESRNNDPTVEPSVDPPRKIPYAIEDVVKTELDRMEDLKVVIKENEPTPWVNSMTVVRKQNNKVMA
ncbi:uncharacterized protein LOC135499855 [Lineus longissimus]|uniref:uncharacterized protein LOC135499855 n=1 Tax=Lineus longissimus TaxID=88925 RepID=UPI00315D6D27